MPFQSDSEEYDSDETEESEEFRDDMRVFLRLRPMNKLENSRRSKNCCELHDEPTLITVDSPLEGEYDFVFDHVRQHRVEVCVQNILSTSTFCALIFNFSNHRQSL